MPRITVANLDGSEQQLDVAPEGSLMEALRGAGYDAVLAMCGGCCACATCHVHLKSKGELPEMGLDEEELLKLSPNFSALSRLSCQIPVTDELEGARVNVLPAD